MVIQKMQPSYNKVLPIEKIISILSYLSMGIIGVIWLIIAYFLKKNLKYFLMYNIAQSMLISILCAIFFCLINLILNIVALVPFLAFISAIINLFMSVKVLFILGMSFSVFQIFLTVLLIYIIVGILLGRIFYVPLLSNIMNKAMKSYL